MRITLSNLIIFILLDIAGGCDKANPLLELAPLGAFRYKAYDTTGVPIVKGWFTLNMNDSDDISGEWHFAQVSHYQNTGPQVGVGKLAGGLYQENLWLVLIPGTVDNNITLYGKLVANTYTGTWSWSTFIGRTNWGRFEANR